MSSVHNVIESFRPTYVWPNPAFPFRVYYESEKCRIFIIENVQHNWEWLAKWHTRFKESDFFFVLGGWYHSPQFADEAENIFNVLGLDKSQFFFLFNSSLEQSNFAVYGFVGAVIGQNAWLDERLVMRPLPSEKKYHAIYVARRSQFKRHYLAAKVPHLALVAGINHGNVVVDVPHYDYINDQPLTPDEVCRKINEAYCGLILSASEGACFASGEYLLCGVPVVSTPSTGGRDEWYNDYNSIICEPAEDAVAEAVEELVRNPRDPERIRQMHIDKAESYRRQFIEVLEKVFLRFKVKDIDAGSYFREHFFHKMRKSIRPDFEGIFGK